MKRYSPGILIVVAILLRLALLATAWTNPHGLFTDDSRGYVALTESMASGEFQQGGQAEIFRAPGYPGFLLLSLAGKEDFWRIAAAAQIFLDAVLVYLTFLLGAMLCDERTGFWAAAFQAVSAVSAVASVRILSDGLFAFLLTLTVLLLVHHFRTGRRWSLVAAAAVLAAGCYVRPVGLAAAAVVVAVLLFRPRRLANVSIFAGIIAAAVATWIVRNGLVAGYWGFSSMPQQVAVDYQAPAMLADRDGISFNAARHRVQDRLVENLGPGPHTPGQLAAAQRRTACQILAGQWPRYAKIHAEGDLAVWLPAASDVLEIAGVTTGGRGTLEVFRKEGPIAAVRNYFAGKTWAIWVCIPLVAILAIEYLLVLVGVIRHVRLRISSALWLILALILLLTLLPGPAGHPRFRTPVEPLLSLAAAAGLTGLRRK